MKIQSHAVVALMSLCMLGLSGQVHAFQIGPGFTVSSTTHFSSEDKAIKAALDEGKKRCTPKDEMHLVVQKQFVSTRTRYNGSKKSVTYQGHVKGYCNYKRLWDV